MEYQKDMEPSEIRIGMIRHKITQAVIARRLGITQPAVSRTIDGLAVSDRIRRAIADAINTDIRLIWPSTYLKGGPRKPGRPMAA